MGHDVNVLAKAIREWFHWKGEIALADIVKLSVAAGGVAWTLVAFYSSPNITIYDYNAVGFFRYDTSASVGQPLFVPRAIVLTGFRIRSIFDSSAILVSQKIEITLGKCVYTQNWIENIEDAGGSNYDFKVNKTTTGYFQEITSKNSFRLEGYFGPSTIATLSPDAKCGSLDYSANWEEFINLFRKEVRIKIVITSFFRGAKHESYVRKCEEPTKAANRRPDQKMTYFGVTCHWQ